VGAFWIGDEGPQILHPLGPLDQPLLDVHADIDHIEARMSGGHLHRDLGSLLLLRYLLEADPDAGELVEVLDMRLGDTSPRGESW
jgi:hypothetical protein